MGTLLGCCEVEATARTLAVGATNEITVIGAVTDDVPPIARVNSVRSQSSMYNDLSPQSKYKLNLMKYAAMAG